MADPGGLEESALPDRRLQNTSFWNTSTGVVKAAASVAREWALALFATGGQLAAGAVMITLTAAPSPASRSRHTEHDVPRG